MREQNAHSTNQTNIAIVIVNCLRGLSGLYEALGDAAQNAAEQSAGPARQPVAQGLEAQV